MLCPTCGKIMNEFEKVYHCSRCDCEVSKDDKNPSLKDLDANSSKLADDHWGYVDMVLIAHGEDLKTRKACGSAYKLGMTLGLAGDSETYNLIIGVFSEGVEPGGHYTKIKTHLETAYEHGAKHAQELNEQS